MYFDSWIVSISDPGHLGYTESLSRIACAASLNRLNSLSYVSALTASLYMLGIRESAADILGRC